MDVGGEKQRVEGDTVFHGISIYETCGAVDETDRRMLMMCLIWKKVFSFRTHKNQYGRACVGCLAWKFVFKNTLKFNINEQNCIRMKVTAGFHRISLKLRRHRQAETINPNDLQEALTRTEKKQKSWKFAVNTLCWNTWHHHATKTHHLFIPANCMIFWNSFGTFSPKLQFIQNFFYLLPLGKYKTHTWTPSSDHRNVRGSAGKKLSAPVYFRFAEQKSHNMWNFIS